MGMEIMKITFPTQDDHAYMNYDTKCEGFEWWYGCSKVMDVLKGFNSKLRYFVPSKTQVVGWKS